MAKIRNIYKEHETEIASKDTPKIKRKDTKKTPKDEASTLLNSMGINPCSNVSLSVSRAV